ncbi:unnamed protein product, partial [Mesorhabditis spiculigera]
MKQADAPIASRMKKGLTFENAKRNLIGSVLGNLYDGEFPKTKMINVYETLQSPDLYVENFRPIIDAYTV